MFNPGERKLQGSKTSSQSKHMYIYGPQYTKICIFGSSGGPGWPINNRTGPILLLIYSLTYINLHIQYGSNPIRIFLCLRESDEMSVDADAA